MNLLPRQAGLHLPLICLIALVAPPARGASTPALRPPAVPLVACDPYFSIWSSADRLTDVDTTHWTGKPHRLTSLIRIDGQVFRVMGASPAGVPALAQQSVAVRPTRTLYTFEGGGVGLTLTFMTAALPEDIDLLSRPVTYVTWEARATDGKVHEVSVYFDAGAELAVNLPAEPVVCAAPTVNGDLRVARLGAKDQAVLDKKGDDLRIDWGYLYAALPTSAGTVAPRARATAVADFASGARAASVPPPDGAAEAIVLAAHLPLGKVAAAPVSRWLILAYDDLFSIQYAKQNLRPYWRRHGWEAIDLLQAAARDYPALQQRCARFDEELMADLTRAGGENYAQLAALAYRQCFAAGKFAADANGQPLQFSKENHSNGCIATSDVFYPMAPQFLLFGPSLAKSFIVPFMNYAASPRWKFPFAPHDLGTYPKANGQVYGDGELGENNQMPVEESGNLLLLFGAVAQMEGNANFAGLYWQQLEQWAGYLKAKGFDPENQLCTDDFAGHLAHNINLSVKAICGLGAFARLCELRGDQATADAYFALARQFAQRWVKEADDGDHFRLAFDKPGTWSQKYNLIWDRILGLDLFPEAVRRKEMAYYRRNQQPYGLPLDNRQTYTKLDWITWTATLTQNRADFEALVDPVIRFLNATPDRSPLTDWYFTDTAKKRGFTARPVVGGVFAQLLYDRAVWQKYAGRDQTKAAGWAPMPARPAITVVVSAADTAPGLWRYATTPPTADWAAPVFTDTSWSQGLAGFGLAGTPGASIATKWDTPEIWLRRDFELKAPVTGSVQVHLTHTGECEVFLNGALAVRRTGSERGYDDYEILPEAQAALRVGRNVIAVHAKVGGNRRRALVDAGLGQVRPAAVSLTSLLGDMTDRAALARLPAIDYRLRSQSSYNRASKTPADPVGWFANRDQGHFIRVDEKGGRKEWVLFEHDRPGAIVRLWMPDQRIAPGRKSDVKTRLHVYLDGAEQPVIAGHMIDLFNGTSLVPPPLGHASLSSAVSFLPIPYAKSCKITTDAPPFYYIIDYRDYAAGTPVRTFTLAECEAARGLMETTGRALLYPADPDGPKRVKLAGAVAAGAERGFDLPAGPGAVRALSLQLDPTLAPQALRSLVLRIAFDGQETVWCPVGEFFGTGVGFNPFQDWYRTVDRQGGLRCRWVMPYQRTARVILHNLGAQPVKFNLAAAVDAWNWDERSMVFHATWRQQASLPVQPRSDWNYVTLQGQGVYVGDTLTLWNPVPQWWGEGDAKIYVDGEKFPSQFGTGTEDYYGYSWGGMNRGFYEHPFHAQVRVGPYNQRRPAPAVAKPDTLGYNTETRVRALDAMPFGPSLQVDMEIWHSKECRIDYAAAAYWYGRPGTTSNRAPMPEEAARPVQVLPAESR